jgi:serine phosphatase RsbU (regulator of sigma subunit)
LIQSKAFIADFHRRFRHAPKQVACILVSGNRTLLFLVAILFSFAVRAQNTRECGQFKVRNYSAKEYNLVPQNFAITQDFRGIFYFGNNSGILEYDGKTWNTIFTPNTGPVRSLSRSLNGRIYVGGTGELGYLSPDSAGKMTFRSLLPYIPENERNFAEIWKTYATPKGRVYFQASNKIFCWDGHRMKIWKAKTSFHVMFYLDGTLYVREKEIGLKALTDSNLVLIQGGELFAEQKIYFMLPFLRDEALLNTQGHGLFLMKTATQRDYTSNIKGPEQLTKVVPFHTQIDEFMSSNEIYNCIKLNNRSFSIGTLGAGLTTIDTSGNLVGVLNKLNGLQDGAIHDQFLDAQGILWLATNNGISKANLNSTLSSFSDKNGLEGTVQSIQRFQGKIYAATNQGVFYLQEQKINKANASIEPAHFVKYAGINSECWDLLPFSNASSSSLLVASNVGVQEIADDKIKSIVNGDINVLFRSRKDPNRVYVGLASGLTSIYRKGSAWIDEGLVSGISDYIQSIDEDEKGNIWIGRRDHGVIRIGFETGPGKHATVLISEYNNKEGLPDENVYVRSMNGRMYFATSRGLYAFEKERFRPDSSFGKRFASEQTGIFRMNTDQKGNIWIAATDSKKFGEMEIGYVSDTNRKLWNNAPFLGLSKNITLAIYHDADGITWLGGPDGIIRYDAGIVKNYDQGYLALVRKVILGKDSVIFSGNYLNDSGLVSLNQPELLKPHLKYSFNSFTFHFAATDFEDESVNVYSYYLEGFDKQWSAWKNENKAVYTNLPEGQYFFRVKAKNIHGKESKEAVFEFTVLAPWYRTLGAYAGYLLLFIGFVYGAITISTRGLRNIISERTAEVVKQKELIELKNKDITDSINYAKRIQEAILPTLENFKSLFPESFILFKPKDIVSGDFYWLTEKNGQILVAAADCTGHGVPGAFTSMIGNALLNEIVNDRTILEPGKILDALREGIIKALKQSGKEGESKDGMDISLCSINAKTKQLQFAGAYNPLFIVRKGTLIEIKADKYPIGISDRKSLFTNHTLDLQKGDTLYIFSDGFADQFGGPDGKKFMRKRFKEHLLQIQAKNMDEQWKMLNLAITEWQGPIEQVDDILIIGIRI